MLPVGCYRSISCNKQITNAKNTDYQLKNKCVLSWRVITERMKARPIAVVREKTRTILQEESVKDGRLRGDDGRSRNATREQGTEAQVGRYFYEARGHSARPSGRFWDRRSRSELSSFQSGCEK
jgi:hypothetical protein